MQVVDVAWTQSLGLLRTIPTYQVVVNPLTVRSSPIHDAVYASIKALNASMVRFVPWLPYPRLGVAELEPPSGAALCGFRDSDSGSAFPVTIDCGGHGTIAAITFASYGTPTGA